METCERERERESVKSEGETTRRGRRRRYRWARTLSVNVQCTAQRGAERTALVADDRLHAEAERLLVHFLGLLRLWGHCWWKHTMAQRGDMGFYV